MDIRLTYVATLFQHILTLNQRWVFTGYLEPNQTIMKETFPKIVSCLLFPYKKKAHWQIRCVFVFGYYLKWKLNVSYYLNHFCYWFLYCWLDHKVGITLVCVLSITLGYFWRNIHNLVTFYVFTKIETLFIYLFFLQNAWKFNLVIILLSVTSTVFQSIYNIDR